MKTKVNKVGSNAYLLHTHMSKATPGNSVSVHMNTSHSYSLFNFVISWFKISILGYIISILTSMSVAIWGDTEFRDKRVEIFKEIAFEFPETQITEDGSDSAVKSNRCIKIQSKRFRWHDLQNDAWNFVERLKENGFEVEQVTTHPRRVVLHKRDYWMPRKVDVEVPTNPRPSHCCVQ